MIQLIKETINEHYSLILLLLPWVGGIIATIINNKEEKEHNYE